MKELSCFIIYINPATALTNPLLKGHMEGLGAWQDLVGGKNTIKENVSAQIQFFFVTAPLFTHPHVPTCEIGSLPRLFWMEIIEFQFFHDSR